ncbi:hypothetical protein G3I60_33970 [Streptomyces sp. SID13666]|uniref:hypothetical protein n=1 Tax=unclassified Streptomyces TaxID=2593676 RepID=UPI0011058C02|nr:MULTISPECIES: hypothetical protein [Streptomyces]MCZ4100965.1 hypothetical protein [Streptomyces sp. H39-C1]NEA59032.1 hypothetical protein [Streptomyces sp. SID13666]NEA74492.1 hypothetical protein [Streptomyces sp. SID13588]QNA72862.1 hypothetical protein C8250_013900 [Streptomyces sp. So13.3]
MAVTEIEHGFPHLATIQSSLTALYRRLSADTVEQYPASVRPESVEFPPDEDPYLGAQRVARVMLQHFRLPDARMVVGFRDMVHAGSVELAAGPEYFVELHSRFKTDRRDVGAALAHEVMHVYLHRLGLELPGTRDNEILTDTATAFLGAGWLLLDSYREEPAIREDRLMMSAYKLGYLTPEEYGYVLAKRALVFGDDIEPWFSSPLARDAYRAGLVLAEQERRQPPLLAAGWTARRRYARDRRAGTAQPAAPLGGYSFEATNPPRVSFPCPTCHQRIRVPVRGRVTARCTLCRTVLECDT